MKNIESNKLSFFSGIGKIHVRGVIVLVSLLISISVYSQGIKSTVEVDTNEILIGDHINLSIFVSSPEGNKIFWPNFIDTITKDIEIVEKSLVDTLKNIEENTYSQRLIITVFDSGFYYIPPVRFYYHRPDDTTLYYFDSDPIPITVNTIDVDTSKVIKDIKAPLGAPLTFKEMLPWILGGIVVALIIYFIFYYLRRRKQSKPLFQIKSKPKIPPHRKALEALDKLKNEKLWQNGKVKEYHTELTDIVRIYLEERYNIMAVEMTTSEILDALKNFTIDKQSMEKLDHILVLADFVKFAKLQPLPMEHDMSLNDSVDFVKETMQRAMEKPSVEQNQDTDEKSESSTADNDNLLKE